MSLGELARSLLNRIGIDVYRFPMLNDRRLIRGTVLDRLEIDLVLDVGANVGQYAREIRSFGYKGRVISFEPVDEAFSKLRQSAKSDPSWECRQLALGDSDGTAEINVANTLSSFLSRDPATATVLDTQTRGRQSVTVARLDSIWPEVRSGAKHVWLKMDVQGFEIQVLRGADRALEDLLAVEMEMAIKPLYNGVPTYREMIGLMESKGFTLWSLHPGARDLANGRLMEMDGLFVKERIVEAR